MSGLDWGTVPAWFSAVLTGGSLLLGFYILLRDRRKEERNEALKVVTWTTMKPEDRGRFARIHIRNTADRPILYVQALLSSNDRMQSHHAAEPLLTGGEEMTLDVPRYTEEGHMYEMAVSFQDPDGINWVKDLDSYSVYRGFRHRRGKPKWALMFTDFGTYRTSRQRKKRLRRGPPP